MTARGRTIRSLSVYGQAATPPRAFLISRGQYIYAADAETRSIYVNRLDPGTGQMTPLPDLTTPVLNRPIQLVMYPNGQHVLSLNLDGSLSKFDTDATGALIPVLEG